ncbi:hypothetical protein HanIR_Chr08g0370111 [Helianthus annuus]|nr:hypothetical protein HanIR_Chr08g0370111 [Helianthus annuus]
MSYNNVCLFRLYLGPTFHDRKIVNLLIESYIINEIEHIRMTFYPFDPFPVSLVFF